MAGLTSSDQFLIRASQPTPKLLPGMFPAQGKVINPPGGRAGWWCLEPSSTAAPGAPFPAGIKEEERLEEPGRGWIGWGRSPEPPPRGVLGARSRLQCREVTGALGGDKRTR